MHRRNLKLLTPIVTASIKHSPARRQHTHSHTTGLLTCLFLLPNTTCLALNKKLHKRQKTNKNTVLSDKVYHVLLSEMNVSNSTRDEREELGIF